MLDAEEKDTERIAVEPEADEQDEYPLTEIREDLDEEGNIICS